MRYQKRIYLTSLLLLLALYLIPASQTFAARISGDNKVTPSAPAPEQLTAIPGQDVNASPNADTADNPSAENLTPGTVINPVVLNAQNESSVNEEGSSNTPPSVSPAPAGTSSSSTRRNNISKTPAGRGTGISTPKTPAVSPGAAQGAPANAGKTASGYVTIDFDNVDITLFIKFISELTGRNFVIDNNVKGKVTVISPTKITVDEAYKVFESVLEINGFTTVVAGSVTKIVPMVEARSKDIETMVGAVSANPDDKLVTQLIPLKFASPEEMKTVLAPFISKNSIMVSYAATNTLIITDILSNIKRLQEIIEKIDVEGTGEIISVIPLQYSGAETMAKSLTSIFKTSAPKTAKDTSASIVIVSDARTNSILTLASEVDTLKIKELIKLLDKESPKGEGDIHVYYLQNAVAEDLAKVLTSLPTAAKSSGSTTTNAAAPKEAAVVLSNNVQILADKATNSLIITAGKDDYLVLEDIIRKLDITRKMVYIEGLIMEVSTTKNFNLGVQWSGGKATGSFNGSNVVSYAASNPGTGDILPSIDSSGNVSLPTGLSLGVLGDTITIGGLSFQSIQAVIRAYSNDSDVHIIETPQIMTTDNEEASINVSENIPYLTRLDTTNGTNTAFSNYTNNYEYKDVGVTLTITPQINQDRFVKLKLDQNVSKIVSTDTAGRPTTLKREAKTTVVIKDGQTIVIGGLIEESKNNATYKVPILGSIPILGYLFRSKSETTSKQNLYIFITPHIVDNPAEAAAIYENKMGQIDQVQEGLITMNNGTNSKTEDDQLCDLAFGYLQANKYEKAAKYYEKALKLNPNNGVALLYRGIIYEKEKDNKRAVEMYQKLITLNPDDRVYSTLNPAQAGDKAVDMAKENLKKIEGENK
jgi:general secretion pathway protein D